jgi:hypothetical protein
MDTSDLYRAAISAGVFVGVCVALGGNAPVSTYATAAAVQAASSWGSDKVHSIVSMWPTATTSAVVTGGLYTAAQHFALGDTNDVSNYAISAGSEFAARTLEGWGQKKSVDVGDAMGEDDDEAY